MAEAERLDVKAMGPLVLTEVLFDEKIKRTNQEIQAHFLRLCHNNKRLSGTFFMVWDVW
jgi:translation initiation factor 5